jgi:hypothetical protein
MKNAEPRTPHFLSLNQDIVVCSQGQECELKYDISGFGEPAQVHLDLLQQPNSLLLVKRNPHPVQRLVRRFLYFR